MKLVLAVLCAAGAFAAGQWPLERLFARPFAWGTKPERITWSKQGHTLVFLWNAEGRRFLDLYAWHADKARLTRVTDLESESDPINLSPAEKDERLKRNLMPPEGLADFAVSRDGTHVAFAYRGDLYVAETDGKGKPFRLTRTKAVEASPQLSPDAGRIAFLRDGQLYVQNLANGQLWQVTEIEGEGLSLAAFRWSPDGKRFAYTVRVGAGRRLLLPNYSGRVVTAAPFPRTLAGDEPGQMRTYVIAAEGGEPKLMETGSWGEKVYSVAPPEWSPDSHRILQRFVHPNLKQARVVSQDVLTGKPAMIAEETDEAWAEPPAAAWSPDSNRVAFTSERDGWAHLYVAPAAGGAARQITKGAWEVSFERTFGREPQWAGDYIYFSSTENGTAERQFYRVRPDGAGKERLSEGEGIHTGFVSDDGAYRAMLEADLNSPFDIRVNGRRVTTSPRAEFAKIAWPETRFIRFPSRGDGQTVAAKMLLPPGYHAGDKSRKWPAVFFIHGSGYATSVLKQWGSYHDLRYVFNCYLASKGYVILDLDYRGSSGYGRDWRTGVYLHMGGKDLEDVLGEIDYARSLGNIDMKRVGIWGSSYGGFMTGMAMFLSPETFRAGAAFSAVNDWENYNAFYTEQRLTRPQDNPEAYRRSSPIFFSSMLKHPLLVVHGIVDNNVLFQDAVQLTEKLIQEGKDFSEIYYPQESHLFVRDESLRDAFRRAAEFFDRNMR